MKKILFVLISLISSLICSNAACAGTRKALTDSIRHRLSYANTPHDSVRMLYDIFDLENSTAQRKTNGKLLYDVAVRAGDTETCLDMLRQLATACASNLDALKKIRSEANRIKKSPTLADTKLFLDLYLILCQSRTASEDDRRKQLTAIIARSSNKHTSWAGQVKDLYTVCAYLSQEGSVNMLADYLYKLSSKLGERPDLHYSIKNLYYTSAAINYTDGLRPFKAVEADKQLLTIIDGLEKQYAAKGRRFRNYDVQKYVSYRRMLQNYKALSPAEIEKYYAAVKELGRKNPAVRQDLNANPRAEAAYLTATRRYSEALPLLHKLLDSSDARKQMARLSLLDMIIESAKATGDERTLAKATEEQKEIIRLKNDTENQNLYRELQIGYDVSQLRAKNAELEIEKRDQELRANQRTLWILAAALIIVIVLVIILLYNYTHTRALSKNLAEAVGHLEEERDTLNNIQAQLITARDRAETANNAKDEFLHSISHEIRTPLNAIMGFSKLIVKKVPDSLMPKLKGFSNQIIYNTELLEVLINDILYLSSIDTHSPKLAVEPTSASTLLSLAAQWTANKVKPGVCIDCPMPRPDIAIRSDRSNIEEVLMKVLANAAKFTDKGSIRLECHDNRDATVSFIITDTGPGIPRGYEEQIFQRFVKLDTFKPGTGLGLYISRRLAETLHGTIRVDTTYTKGTRIVFTIPVDVEKAKAENTGESDDVPVSDDSDNSESLPKVK